MSESTSAPPAVISESGKHVSFAPKDTTSLSETVEMEWRRLKLAPTFDRLIDANLRIPWYY